MASSSSAQAAAVPAAAAAASGKPASGFADHFSVAVSSYRTYRPAYPAELYQYLSSLCSAHDLCVDAGTGNGQAAQSISKYFKRVLAFDPAQTMIQNALKDASNVEYFVSRGEDFASNLPLQAESVDLIISATAVHWMDLPEFYENAHRLLKPGGLLAVFTYDCFLYPENAAATDFIFDFHYNDLLDYWPKEISYTTAHYATLPFPASYVQQFNSQFHQSFPSDVQNNFRIERRMTLEDSVGYLQSWSGTQRWMAKVGKDKFAEVVDRLKKVWNKKDEAEVHPLHMKIGMKPLKALSNEVLELRPPNAPLTDQSFKLAASKLMSERKQAKQAATL